jgi:hypothetical protein
MAGPHKLPLGCMTHEELRRRLAKYKGKRSKGPYYEKKSTTLRVWDFAWLSGINKFHLYDFLAGRERLGPRRFVRLEKWVKIADAGRLQKKQYQVYKVHDEPFQAPAREMRLTLGVQGIKVQNVATAKPSEMPSFAQIFGKKGG